MSAWGSGSARFLRSLMPQCTGLRPDWEWVVFTGPRVDPAVRNIPGWAEVHLQGRKLARRLIHETVRIPRETLRRGFDFMVFPADVGPLVKSPPYAVFCRNPHVVPPDGVNPDGAARYRFQRALLKKSCRRAAVTVTFTKTMSRGVTRILEVPIEKTRVLTPGSDHIKAKSSVVPAASLGVTGPYVLWVGVPYGHKNISGTLAAWERVRHQEHGMKLVVAGLTQKDVDQAGGGGAGVVTGLGYVDPDSMAGLYSGASALLNASLLESYGYPVAEALAAGLPIACSDIPPFRELAPNASFFDPESPEDISRAILAALKAPAVPRGNDYIRTWRECGEEFVRMIETAQ
ncbi:MAG TPA: glycosyltransferase [Actinomycetota bacterium]|nr:glycosyltransferase [Actinomycetota bacterium]